MNAQDLKNSILQLAIEGKLVPQRKEEGTAKELLAEIRAEKARLIKEKKIKKSKPLPEITDEEKPFDIPERWEWVRIGELFSLQAGKNIKATYIYHEQTESHVYPCYGGNGVRGFVEFFNSEGDFPIIGRQGALCGNINRAKGKFYATEHAVLTTTFANTDVSWACYFLKALNLNQYATATAQPGLAVSKINQVLIPLPPLAEQHRIVAKIEELQPDINAYDKAQTKLRTIEQRFPDAMKKSLLQYAIEGKLVPQRKEEGTAKDLLTAIRAEKTQLIKEKKIKKTKPLSAITDDEKPFDIPDGWEWARFGDISINMDSERIPLSVTQRRNLDKIYDYYGASGVIDKVDKYLFDRPLMLIGEDGANLLARTKPIAFIARGKYWVNNHAHVIDFPNGIDMKYMTFYMNAINLAAYVTGTAQPKMNQARMNGILIAIPPITEQHRIVAKLEELLPLCDQLAHQS